MSAGLDVEEIEHVRRFGPTVRDVVDRLVEERDVLAQMVAAMTVEGAHHAPRVEPGASEGPTLADRIRESLDANNAWEWNDVVNGVQTGFDGNKDVLAEAIARDLSASLTSDPIDGA